MIKILLLLLLIVFLIFSFVFVIKSKALKKRALRKMNAMNTKPSDKWTSDFLEGKRKLTDPLADNTVSQIMSLPYVGHTNQLFDYIVKDSDRLPDDAPEALKTYFAKSSVLPDWVDKDLVQLGQQMYIRHGIWISLLLSYKSLPECYACAKGAEVLYLTARLNEEGGGMETYSRRIAETAQFVLSAMSPLAFSGDSEGIVAAQKVRLIHAVIRYYLHQEKWDTKTYDEPINQEDMAGTLMSFSALILEGLEQLGIELEPVEKEAYFHCWRVIGHLVGLDEDLIPENAADGLKLGHSILNHQILKSQQGSSLTDALLKFQIHKSKPLMSAESNYTMFRLMMGKDISDLLDVPQAEQKRIDRLEKKIKRISEIMEFIDHSLVFAMVLQFITKIISQSMINHMTNSKVITFYIPKSLKVDWITSKNAKQ